MVQNELPWDRCPIDLSDADVMEAMREIQGYLDITPGDFRTLYGLAYQKAMRRLLHAITAKDIMTRSVHHVGLDTDLITVAKLLSANNISGAPVLDDDGHVAGIISEKDFLKQMGVDPGKTFMTVIVQCLQNKGCVALPIRKQLAADIMSTPAITTGLDTPVFQIADYFSKNKINRIPVVDKDNKLAGIVTRTDIVAAYCHYEPTAAL